MIEILENDIALFIVLMIATFTIISCILFIDEHHKKNDDNNTDDFKREVNHV